MPASGHRILGSGGYPGQHQALPEPKKKEKKDKKRAAKKKVCKEDISLPTNFQHIHHVGFTPDGPDVSEPSRSS